MSTRNLDKIDLFFWRSFPWAFCVMYSVAHNLHRGKTWIISEAVRRYLEQLESPNLVQEASGDYGKPRPAVIVQSNLF